jgi:type IV pilus assembly protein PilQ
MLHVLALALAVATPGSVVRGLSVVPVADRTEVVIAIDGDVTFKDMLLANPTRLVIDFSDSQHSVGLERFDNVNRGGVRGLRVGQFQPGVVRVVVELDEEVRYRLERAPGEVRVSFPNSRGAFSTWTSPGMQPPAATSPAGRAAAPTRTATTPSPAPRPALLPPQERPITVMFQDEPLSEVIATIGDFAGRTIIAAQGVRSMPITAEVRGQPWDVALQAILQANGLMAHEMPESGIIIVNAVGAVAEQRIAEPVVVRQYPIQYVSADSLRVAVQGLLSERGRVAVNSPANALLITETPTMLAQIEPLLRQLDVRVPQVNIAATIAFIDRTALEEYGIVYDLKDTRGNQLNQVVSGFIEEPDGSITFTEDDVVLLGGNSVAALANANFRLPNPALQLVTSLVMGRHTLVTFLEALQIVSLSDIQAKPVVQTMNHRQAIIQVGESTPIRVLDAGGMGAAQATVQFRDTGIILRVTPHITGDQVMLDLHAERSNIALAPSDIGVTFATQMAQTQVLVDDGQTTVIGGLTITEKSRVRSGIPILMDLPFVGALFRNTAERDNKRDLLIMVTPHIVRD